MAVFKSIELTYPNFTVRGEAVKPLHWHTAALIVIVSISAVLAVFWQTAVSMVAVWYRSETFAHGFLVLPISAYLIWTRRQRVAHLVPAPNLWGLPLLAGLGFGWLLGNLADVLVVQQIALVAVLQGLVWTVLGSPVVSTLRFPLAFLLFAVPIGEILVPPLQDFTAFVTVEALQMSRIPVFLEGRFISIPSGTWEVTKACSGVRYVIPSVVLGCLYASVTYQSWSRRLGFILASVAVPILANGVRAYGIIMLAHLTDNKIASGVDHLVYGWLFFVLVIFLLFWLGVRWRQPVDTDERSQASDLRLSPVITSGRSRASSARAIALTAASSIVLLALAPISAHVLSNRTGAPIDLQAALPQVNLPWKALAENTGNWMPRILGADAKLIQSYTSSHQVVQLYIAYYAGQHQGAELINSENVIVDGKHWVRVAEQYTRALVDSRLLSVHETTMKSSHGTRLVWRWYWVAGQFTASPYYAKFLQARARLLGGPQGAAVIALGSDYDAYRAEAANALQDFLRHTALLATLNGFSK